VVPKQLALGVPTPPYRGLAYVNNYTNAGVLSPLRIWGHKFFTQSTEAQMTKQPKAIQIKATGKIKRTGQQAVNIFTIPTIPK
jgi:hypothetical protein